MSSIDQMLEDTLQLKLNIGIFSFIPVNNSRFSSGLQFQLRNGVQTNFHLVEYKHNPLTKPINWEREYLEYLDQTKEEVQYMSHCLAKHHEHVLDYLTLKEKAKTSSRAKLWLGTQKRPADDSQAYRIVTQQVETAMQRWVDPLPAMGKSKEYKTGLVDELDRLTSISTTLATTYEKLFPTSAKIHISSSETQMDNRRLQA